MGIESSRRSYYSLEARLDLLDCLDSVDCIHLPAKVASWGGGDRDNAPAAELRDMSAAGRVWDGTALF